MMRMRWGGRARSRRGTVVALVSLCLVPILGVVAIAIDGGLLLSNRRAAQRAADCAAMAAAVDMFSHQYTNGGTDPNGTAKQSALTTAAANGFKNDGLNSKVTVNIPPKSGAFANQKYCAEVLISYNQGRFFSRIWGTGNLQVAARSVGRGKFAPSSPGILILDPTDNNTLDVTASGGVTVTNGGAIDVNSQSPNGGATCTNTGNITADTINLSDNTFNHSNSGTLVGTINYNVPPTPDPLAALPEPAQPLLPNLPSSTLTALGSSYSTSQGVNYSGSATVQLYPGYYEGIQITGSGSVVLNPNPDGSPGIYYLGSHGLSITNSGGLTANNVMVYSNGTSDINITGSGSLGMTPPTSGVYKGISFFQERSSSKNINITAQGNMDMTGTFYAAHAKVSITGKGNYANPIGSQWIAWQMAVTGTGSFSVDYSGQATPVRSIGLVE
jgi:Flp pilus assembly protein TadG